MMFVSEPLQHITMSKTTHKTHSIAADENHNIPMYLLEPEGTPTAVIQVFQGLGEHSARYDRFAQAAVDRGYAVCAHDHRGHGPTADQIGFFAAKGEAGMKRLAARMKQPAMFT